MELFGVCHVATEVGHTSITNAKGILPVVPYIEIAKMNMRERTVKDAHFRQRFMRDAKMRHFISAPDVG